MVPKRVLLFGCFDLGPGYPRTRSLLQAFEALGVETECLHRDLLPVRGRRLETAANPLRWPGAALRFLLGARRLETELRDLLERKSFDALLVPYPGYFVAPIAARCFGGPILLDLFLSLPDTVIGDRRMFRKGGLVDRILQVFEQRAIDHVDHVLLDTPEQARFLAETTGQAEEKFSFVPIGDPDAPEEAFPFPEGQERLEVLYIGTGVPLHGVEVLLDAVARVDGVRLTFVGGMPEQRRRAEALGKEKVHLCTEWQSAEDLRRLLRETHLVAGIFGTSEKAQRVLPFKLMHGFAAGRAVVTGDTSAVKTLCDPGRDVMTVPVGDVEALARALDGLRGEWDLCRRVGLEARRSYERRFAPSALGARLRLALELVSGESWGAAASFAGAESSTSSFGERPRTNEAPALNP